MTKNWLAAVALAVGVNSLLPAHEARAQAFPLQQNDLAIAVNSNTPDGFRIVRQPGSPITPTTLADSGVLVSGGPAGSSPSSREFIQTTEFDNANGISHNANGNLLGGNFGNAFTGFEIFNFATNGSSANESLWSVRTVTGGAETTRGGGLSVNPANNLIGWSGYDGNQLHVMAYDAGNSVGAGSGASITGWLQTANGDGAGNAGALAPLTSQTSGTAWLNDTTLLAINGFGEVVRWDVSGLTSTDPTTPTTDSGWDVVATGLFPNAQFMDIEYNAEVDPDHIVVSRGAFAGGITTNQLFVLDATTFAVVDTIDISASTNDGNSAATLREIAYDSEGNLFVGGFGENIVSVIPNFTDNIGSLADNSSIYWYNNDFFASFSGLDVALSLPIGGVTPTNTGDYNGDGVVNAADYTVWRDGGVLQNETASPGVNDQADYDAWAGAYGANYNASTAAVPEPVAASLVAIAAVFGLSQRRRSQAAC